MVRAKRRRAADDSRAADDLRATADSIAHDAERLAAVERLKSDLTPANPVIGELAVEAQALVEKMRLETAAERELAEATGEATDDRSGAPRTN